MRQAFIVLFFTFWVALTAQTQSKVDPLQLGEYADLWNKVAHAEKLGKPKAAKEAAAQIYLRAKADRNQPQMLMALVSAMRYNTILIDADGPANYQLLKTEIESADFPIKNVLQSILATESEKWVRYTDGLEDDDPNRPTKDRMPKIVWESILGSLDSADALKAISIGDWKAAIAPETWSSGFRVSLYDILAWRAIKVLQEDLPMFKSEATDDADRRPLMDVACFAPSKTFANHRFDSMIGPQSIGEALRILQELTRHHLNDADPRALMDVELQRLRFVNTHTHGLNADSLYYQALIRMQVHYGAQDTSLLIADRMRGLLAYGDAFWFYLGNRTRNWEEELERVCRMALAMQPRCRRASNFQNSLQFVMFPELRLSPISTVSPGKPIHVAIPYKNISYAWLKVVRLPTKATADWSIRMVNEDGRVLKHLLKMPSMKDTLLTLPVHWDHRSDTFDLELPGMQSGDYCLIASSSSCFDDEDQPVVVAPLTVTSFGWVTRIASNFSRELIVMDRESGKPLSGVEVWLERHLNGKGGYHWKTNEKGFVGVPAELGSDQNLFFASLTKGNERILRKKNNFIEWSWKTKQDMADTSVLIFTDRSIYRPGQELHYKCIAFRDSAGISEVLQNFAVPFFLKSRYRDTVFKSVFKTNSKGSFSGSIPIPLAIQRGEHEIRTEFSKRSITIEDYRRPQFEVLLDPDRGYAEENGKIKVTGKARRFNGAAVTNATVRYDVRRGTEYYKFIQHPWRNRRYNMSEAFYQLTGTSKTGPDGSISFEIPRDSAINMRNYTKETIIPLEVSVTVADASGESVKKSTKRTVQPDRDALRIVAPPLVKKGDTPLVQVTYEGRGNPQKPITVKYQIHRLQADSLHPVAEWKAESSATASSEIELLETASLPLGDMEHWRSGAYRIELSMAEGTKRCKHDFELFGESDRLPPVPSPLWITDAPIHTSAGDTADMWIGSMANEVWALYEWEVGGEIVHQEWLTIRRELRQLSIPIPADFAYRKATVHVTSVFHNQLHKVAVPIYVHSRWKDLKLQFASFRDRMSPGKEEEWSIKISGADKESVAAEMIACMYDASLDQIKPHDWPDDDYDDGKALRAWNLGNPNSSNFQINLNPDRPWFGSPPGEIPPSYEDLNLMGYDDYSQSWQYRGFHSTKPIFRPHLYWFYPKFWYRAIFRSRYKNLPPRRGVRSLYIDDLDGDYKSHYLRGRSDSDIGYTMVADPKNDIEVEVKLPKPERDLPVLTEGADRDPIRRDLRETAFFFPDLQTDASGNVILKFKSPEALTRWRFMSFAHTGDMRTGYLEADAVTQKPIMIVPYPPRFFREGDTVIYKATVSNLSNADQSGEAKLTLLNEVNGKVANAAFGLAATGTAFSVKRGESTIVEWRLAIPAGFEAITHRVTTEAGEFSDGEESMVPILPRQMMVLQSQPIWIPPGQTVRIPIAEAHPSDRLSLEIATDPLWEVIQSLPYMMEFPYECAEQTFSRYYANVLAAHILSQHPDQMAKLEAIRSLGKGGYLSKLEQHPELKTILLAETPWLSEAREEKERIQNLALLTDPKRLAAERDSMAARLLRHERDNTNFGWFARMNRNPFLTQSVLTGFGRLDRLGASRWKDAKGGIPNLVRRLVRRLDLDLRTDYQAWKKDTVRASLGIQPIHIHALYARSFFPDVNFETGTKEAYRFYLDQAKDQWAAFDPALQAMVAMVMHRRGDANAAMQILDGLREQAIRDPKTGMNWKGAKIGWARYLGPVQAQCLMIEAFLEVGKDAVAVSEMQQWLLGKKRLSNWGSTMATADACYALLLNHQDFGPGLAIPKVAFIDGSAVQIKPLESTFGTGRTQWNLSSADFSQSRTIEITNAGSQPIWGAVCNLTDHQATKIAGLPSAMRIKKTVWTVPEGKDRQPVLISAQSKLRIGQDVTVRLEFEADADFAFVHLHDQRSSGFEPVKIFSECILQSQVWHYRSTKDAATDFFMDWLPKGNYTFEYPLRVSHQGDFGGGTATIQCMYAPEFIAHSEDAMIRVEE